MSLIYAVVDSVAGPYIFAFGGPALVIFAVWMAERMFAPPEPVEAPALEQEITHA